LGAFLRQRRFQDIGRGMEVVLCVTTDQLPGLGKGNVAFHDASAHACGGFIRLLGMLGELKRGAAVADPEVGLHEGLVAALLQCTFERARIHILDKIIRPRTHLDVEELPVLSLKALIVDGSGHGADGEYKKYGRDDPSTRGFGFAVLEGPNRLIDWGVKETKTDKRRRALKLVVEDFIERYQPDVLVVEDYRAKGSRRCRRVQTLIADISRLAAEKKIKVRKVSRLNVKQAFSESGASNKYEIAVAIANRFPELASRSPRFRKAWMSEDYRMSIFDSVAFAVAFSRFEKLGMMVV
jgi:Holliday junction resolvasome RuvABC endonuclease subunit